MSSDPTLEELVAAMDTAHEDALQAFRTVSYHRSELELAERRYDELERAYGDACRRYRELHANPRSSSSS